MEEDFETQLMAMMDEMTRLGDILGLYTAMEEAPELLEADRNLSAHQKKMLDFIEKECGCIPDEFQCLVESYEDRIYFDE
jgi:hypothetical protein